MAGERSYLCIDLKSFYASVECVERGLDPMTTNLVVADSERGTGTICLAVTPAMKAKGVRNRCRVYEIPDNISYITAQPRMKRYLQYSADIYRIYLQFVAKEDIHVYSIDEAFLDVTAYLDMYGMGAGELAETIITEVRRKTGITAVAGVGTNLYLAKVAMDILAKNAPDHIGYLDEIRYREKLWNYRPLSDFWRIGKGIEKRLQSLGIHTMKEIACTQEDILYRMFGVDAELLIDHAWGRESTTIADIKSYRVKSSSLSNSQVLLRDYTVSEGTLLVKEMLDALCLELVEKRAVTESVTLVVGYSRFSGEKPDSGTVSLPAPTNSYQEMAEPVLELYQRIAKPGLPLRKITLNCNKVREEGQEQLSLFRDWKDRERERNLQKAILGVKERYGKNALIRGMDLLEGGTARDRNRQIGGHKSGE